MNNFNIEKYKQLCKYELDNFKKCNENKNRDKHYCQVLESLYVNCKHFKEVKVNPDKPRNLAKIVN